MESGPFEDEFPIENGDVKSHHHLKVCIPGTSPRDACRWAWSQSDLRALEMGIFYCYVSLPEGIWKGVTSSRSWIDVEKMGIHPPITTMMRNVRINSGSRCAADIAI